MQNFINTITSLIEGFEGFSALPYQDRHEVWTRGYGHTKGVTADSSPVTRDQAVQLLLDDMQVAINAVEDFLEVGVNDNQKAALVSIVFNEGPKVLKGHLGEYLNDGDFEAAAGQFDVWIYISERQPDGTFIKVKSDGLI